MFTGIIEAVGTVGARELHDGDVRLTIDTGSLSLTDSAVGESIAVNGVCLTAVSIGKQSFIADVSRETLNRTTLQQIGVGNLVNLERALMATSRLGGHLVSGHVDGVAELLKREPDGRSIRMTIRVPDELGRYIAVKGSVCLDGVSLTVNTIDGNTVSVNVVPHTLKATTLNGWTTGSRLNLEVDVVARYLERLLDDGAGIGVSDRPITADFLFEHGFLKKS